MRVAHDGRSELCRICGLEPRTTTESSAETPFGLIVMPLDATITWRATVDCVLDEVRDLPSAPGIGSIARLYQRLISSGSGIPFGQPRRFVISQLGACDVFVAWIAFLDLFPSLPHVATEKATELRQFTFTEEDVGRAGDRTFFS